MSKITELRAYTPRAAASAAASGSDRGAYLRKGKRAVGSQLVLEDINEEVLDIPTFLRRQAD
jgi:hypothetical protein